MMNTARKRAIVKALTDFRPCVLHKFGPPPMPASIIAKIIGESDKLSSVCQSLRKLAEDGVLVAEQKYCEVNFSRNGVMGFQIKKCTVYWNAASMDFDMNRRRLWYDLNR
ncbi:hypothetical protein [Laribacter hongkongensis]|uniref:hypothetical protein n=1 Tax=Laribacter hongkongensis TaxID=168471 RepID=UPI001EFE900D|nr:hypothetical protein [Laribacter hongkongensis]MCG9096412.1 hypothetical protein [Laribacter hongkongensis]MCG9125921.1 hypothetical protein [Laribacter hongkongensis]